MKKHALYSIVMCLTLAVGFSVCTPVRVNGGETVSYALGNGADWTNLGSDTCTPGVTNSTFTYRDETAPAWPRGGVELQGQVFDAARCLQGANGTGLTVACELCKLQFYDCACSGWPDTWEFCAFYLLANPPGFCESMTKMPRALYGAMLQFTSTNPSYPGSGMGFACVTDRGDQRSSMTVIVATGQYKGYIYEGPVRGIPIAPSSTDTVSGCSPGSSSPQNNGTSGTDTGVTSPIPTVKVKIPNGGETWGAGTTQTIAWTYQGDPGKRANIVLVDENYGQPPIRTMIAEGVPMGQKGTGTYAWQLPWDLWAGRQYWIDVVSMDMGYSDRSDGPFSITGWTGPPPPTPPAPPPG